MKTSGHTALITGGGTGIGLAIAEKLSLQDNTIIICGRRKAPLVAAKNRLPNVYYRVCDLSKPSSRRALVKWATTRFKELDLLVNNAGVQRTVDFLKGDRDLARTEEEIATNLVAPIHLSALLIPHLRRKRARHRKHFLRPGLHTSLRRPGLLRDQGCHSLAQPYHALSAS